MGEKEKHIKRIGKVVVYVPQKSVVAVRVVHHHLLVRPHDHLMAKSKAYAGWHGKKHHGKIHVFALTAFTLAIITASLGMTNIAKAYQTLTQTDWSGGVGSSVVNQYSSSDNADVSNAGEIRVGSSTASGWCNTATCDQDSHLRQEISIQSDQARSDYQVPIKVPWKYGMQANFGALRFINADGSDAPYYIVSKTDSVEANVMVKVNTLNLGLTKIGMYYGGPGASTASGADTFDFFDDFSGGSLDTNKWDAPDGNATVSGGNLELDGAGVMYAKDNGISLGTPSAYEFSPQVDHISDQVNCNATSFSFNLSSLTNIDHASLGLYCNSSVTGYRVFGDSVSSYVFMGADIPYGSSDIKYQIGSNPLGNAALGRYSTDGVTWSHYPDETAPLALSGTDGPLKLTFSIDGNGNTKLSIPYVYRYQVGANTVANFGLTEVAPDLGGKMATLTSNIFDTGASGAQYGAIHVARNVFTDGAYGLRIWGSDNADMSDAVTGDHCPILVDGQQITSVMNGDCTGPEGKRYFQYQVLMTVDGSSPADASIQEVTVDYAPLDNIAPTTPTNITMKLGSASGNAVANGAFTNLGIIRAYSSPPQSPYFEWSGASDTGGSGVQGYCAYFGTDNTADPQTTKGTITDSSVINTGGACPYAVSGTSLNLSTVGNSANLTAQDTSADDNYYLRVRTIDGSGNLSVSTQQFEFKLDTVSPSLFVPNAPGGTHSGTNMEIQWPTNAGPALGNLPTPTDISLGGGGNPHGVSGIKGIRYCIASVALTFNGYCYGNNSSWYGANGSTPITLGQLTSGGGAGLIDATSGSYVADLSTNPAIDLNGNNVLTVVVMDNAGNFTNIASGDFNPTVSTFYILNNTAPSLPQNLTVTPNSSGTNSFSFSWDAPANLVGQASNANYCWSVNVVPDVNHCSYAGKGITSLSSDAYATQPGLNTMYVVAKDEAGNIDYSNRASVTFTANTTAPGATRNLEVIDASNKATSSWKLALSWDTPVLPGSGVSKYKVYRSLDDITYNEVGSTTATSFVDSGLDQVTYYYKVAACDNANNCGAQSNSDSLMPTGRYTEPALLVAGPQVTDVKTRSARVFWGTDRVSDTKVAYGTSSGNYFAAEAYQSTQVTAHSIELPNLQPGTTYYYRAKWSDDDGNTGQYAEQQFTTAPAPVVSDVSTTSVNLDQAGLKFTTQGAVRVKIYYGKTSGFGAVTSINTSADLSTYTTQLTGLDDGTKYFYRVNTIDSSGYEYDGSVASFTTIARPRISNLRFQTVEGEPSSTQKITWDTNVGGSSELAYGPKGGKQLEAVTADNVTSHEVVIRGLEDDTQYTLVARTRDTLGNVATSETQEFHTALDTRAPVVSELNTETSIRGTGAEARGQIIVTWKTDEPATSQVAYGVGAGASASTKTAEDARLTTDHIVIISDLATSSVYSVQAVSTDKAHNPTTSTSQSVVVGRGTDNIFSVIFTAIQKIFGFKL